MITKVIVRHKSLSIIVGAIMLALCVIAPTANAQDKNEQANAMLDEAATLARQGTAQSMGAAIPKFEEARKIYHQIGAEGSEALCLGWLGKVYSSLYENSKALDYLNQALLIRVKIGDVGGQAITLNNIGNVYLSLGEKSKALDYLNQALPLLIKTGDIGEQANTLNNIGNVYSSLGEKAKALDYYNQALSLTVKVGDVRGQAMTLVSIGEVHKLSEETLKALDYFNQALPLRVKVGDVRGQAFTLSNIGSIHNLLGEKSKALDYFNQALPLFMKVGDVEQQAFTLAGISKVYWSLGENSKALDYLNQALPLVVRNGGGRAQATLLNQISGVYWSFGENSKALDCLNQALPLFIKVGDVSGQAMTLGNIGKVYWSLGENSKALNYHNQALPLKIKVSDVGGQAFTLNNIGLAYSSLNENSKALDYYNQALPLFIKVGDVSGQAMTLNNMMFAWQSQNNPRFAAFYGKQSVNKLQNLRQNAKSLDKQVQQTYLKSVSLYYRLLANYLIADNRLAEAQQVLNSFKDQQFFDQTTNRLQPLALTTRETELGTTFNFHLERVGTLNLQVADERRKLNDRRPNQPEAAQIKRLETDLQQANRDYIAFLKTAETQFAAAPTDKDKTPSITDLANMQSALRQLSAANKQNAVAVYTVVGDAEYQALIVTPDSISSITNPISGAELDKKALQFWTTLRTVWHREDTPNRALWGKPRYDAQPLAKEMYDAIFAPLIAKLPADTKTILWSLDGNLRYVPMAALHDGKDYLVTRYNNVIFTRADKERLTRSVAANLSGSGFGSSKEQIVQLDNRTLRASALPNVKTELARIFKTADSTNGFVTGEVLLDEDFTRATLVKTLQKRRPLVLIASHFRFLPGDEARSFLLLGDGKPFTLDEMKREKELFAGVDLLTLSACDTAAQQPDANGREVDGFAELAQRQGAGAVMASLWEVSDKSTSELMTRFFTNYKPANVNKATALQNAQLALLRGEYKIIDTAQRFITQDETGTTADNKRIDTSKMRLFSGDKNVPFAHPYYWSPFILIGNIK